ncbi:hypothetical protein [Gordonia sp. OPL2]|uniref:hypothetical protein n=1 Tax=Gordonia sp. OPL2 TaxID=2486274 RepID=UPI0016554627|nr:hypothetical protein [Gordonia sp. OPL2]RPA12228.1 hypothetical protein EEB19_07900 [Gordonia sp. OPL2]
MTDYYPLPGDSVSIPNSSTPSTVPLDGGTASGGVVKLTAGEWEKRAQVAADGAARLAAASVSLSRVAAGNYFGECSEGTGMFEALAPVITTFRTQLERQAQELTGLAEKCVDAKHSLSDTDRLSQSDFHA